MKEDLITAVIGLVVGLMTGYIFEWRNGRATRQHNLELQHQLRDLRESVYAVGRGSDDLGPRNALKNAPELAQLMAFWIREYQGPDGRLQRRRVLSQFLEDGHSRTSILDNLRQLEAAGQVRVDDEWIEVL